jgi:hypothetical protein
VRATDPEPKEQAFLRASLHWEVARHDLPWLRHPAPHVRGLRVVREELLPTEQGRQILLCYLRSKVAWRAGPKTLRSGLRVVLSDLHTTAFEQQILHRIVPGSVGECATPDAPEGSVEPPTAS